MKTRVLTKEVSFRIPEDLWADYKTKVLNTNFKSDSAQLTLHKGSTDGFAYGSFESGCEVDIYAALYLLPLEAEIASGNEVMV